MMRAVLRGPGHAAGTQLQLGVISIVDSLHSCIIINILKYGNMRDARVIVKKTKTCGPGGGVGKPLLPARLDLPKKTIFWPAKIKSTHV